MINKLHLQFTLSITTLKWKHFVLVISLGISDYADDIGTVLKKRAKRVSGIQLGLKLYGLDAHAIHWDPCIGTEEAK